MLTSKISKKIVLSITCLILFLSVSICYATFSASAINAYLNYCATREYSWQCHAVKEKRLTSNGSVKWLQLSCTNKRPAILFWLKPSIIQPLIINLVDANLSDTKLDLAPAIAQVSSDERPYISNMSEMGKANPHFIAGINGGYFFLTGKNYDGNCPWKRSPALTPETVGDGLLVIQNKLYSTNCGNTLHSTLARASIVQDQSGHWDIKEVPANIRPANIKNGLGAGPVLISQDQQGRPQMAIRWESILSTFEFSANTALALAKDKNAQLHAVFFTVDGLDNRAGMRSFEMANFIYKQVPVLFNLELISAMSMDQGHSTGMYIRDETEPMVSKSDKYGKERPVYDALFIVEKSNKA